MTHRRMWWAATVAALVVLVLSVVTSLGAPSVGARPAHWGWSSDTWSAHVRRAPTPTPSPSPTASPTAQPAASPPPLLPPPPGASALSMYPFNAAATTVSTDGAMTSTTSGTAYKGLPVQTPGSGTKTGWIEFQWSLDGGTVNTSGLASSIGSPDAHGYLYDSTALEGQQFVAGNWSTTEQLWLPTGVTATVTERVYVRHSDGTYTAITSLTSGSITGNSGYQSASASSTTSTATSFATGDKPYMDAWLDITSNSLSANADAYFQEAASNTIGIPADSVVTPGYQSSGGGGGGSVQSALIPAYWSPSDSMWTTLASNPTTQASYIIANNGNGPGTVFSSTLNTDINNARAAGYKVIGYDITNLGTRSETSVKADVDSWYNWYALDGIFFDDLSGYQSSQETYYTDLYNYVKAKTGSNVKNTLVIDNGAAIPSDQNFLNISDSLTTFEGTEATFTSNCNCHASWMDSYAASHFSVIIHTSAGSTSLQTAIDDSEADHAGLFYDTNQSGYSTPPTNWPTQVTDLNN